MALLTAGLAKARDNTGINNLPEQFRNRMDVEGYTFDQKNFGFPKQNTNSLRQLPFVERRRFIPFVLPVKKSGWSLWNNSSFKYVGNKTDQISLLSSSAALSHYEYDITYSFEF
jgi:hypothetical protein